MIDAVLSNYIQYIYSILYSIFYLCVCVDAVYLYLLTLNQTLAEGNLDYRNGRLIVNKTIGQRFAGKLSTRITDLLVDHRLTPLHVQYVETNEQPWLSFYIPFVSLRVLFEYSTNRRRLYV